MSNPTDTSTTDVSLVTISTRAVVVDDTPAGRRPIAESVAALMVYWKPAAVAGVLAGVATLIVSAPSAPTSSIAYLVERPTLKLLPEGSFIVGQQLDSQSIISTNGLESIVQSVADLEAQSNKVSVQVDAVPDSEFLRITVTGPEEFDSKSSQTLIDEIIRDANAEIAPNHKRLDQRIKALIASCEDAIKTWGEAGHRAGPPGEQATEPQVSEFATLKLTKSLAELELMAPKDLQLVGKPVRTLSNRRSRNPVTIVLAGIAAAVVAAWSLNAIANVRQIMASHVR
jgi:hypothetical protein